MLVRKYDQTKTKKDHNSKHEMTAHIKCYLVKKEDSNGYLGAVESEKDLYDIILLIWHPHCMYSPFSKCHIISSSMFKSTTNADHNDDTWYLKYKSFSVKTKKVFMLILPQVSFWRFISLLLLMNSVEFHFCNCQGASY